jgi:putative flippase GtrA
MYNLVGKIAVKIAFRYLWQRYRHPARFAIGLSVAVAAVAAYLANREVPEG